MTIHLISFNIPDPPNYGGVIDVFYKIKALAKQGINVHLHCFEYGRKESQLLEQLCEKVYYYKRKTGWLYQLHPQPYIVHSRQSKLLLSRIATDDHPILFEGLHCCKYLDHAGLGSRQKIVRMHNIEWQYYQHLANVEPNVLKKIYFKIESWKLKKFEKKLAFATDIFAISKNDMAYLQTYPNVRLLYPFHQNEKVLSHTGKGEYILFHGDLSVKDNEEAAVWLIDNVFKNIDQKVIIAGLNPTNILKEKCRATTNISLEANVSKKRMDDLVKNAHIHILWSYQSAGMKLKLLNVLYAGRFCVANDFMVSNTGLEALCKVENTAEGVVTVINELWNKAFTREEISHRKQLLSTFSNENGANKIKDCLINIVK